MKKRLVKVYAKDEQSTEDFTPDHLIAHAQPYVLSVLCDGHNI